MAVGVIGSLGSLHRFCSRRLRLGESPALRQRDDEVTAGEYRGQPRQTKALLAQGALETRHVLLETCHCLTIVPKTTVDTSQIVLLRDREANISEGRSTHQGTLTGREGAVWDTNLRKMGQ
jgi:hypothetical protein